ncbi:hypothetical protein HK102_004986 [Quaeritorhiza haematococci]|nr:hypothetical protein HK102_004986 [Quaeritorhiza haematococci]
MSDGAGGTPVMTPGGPVRRGSNGLQQQMMGGAGLGGAGLGLSGSVGVLNTASSAAYPVGRGEPLPDPDPQYLKHVILKFIEAKDKRQQLVHVIAMLLKFTPDELKRAERKV